MPDEMTPSPEEGISKKRPAQVAVAVVMLIILGVAAWYIFKPKTEEPAPGPESGQPNLPILGEGEQISWQDYNNQKYGYFLKYPQSWYLDASRAENDFSQNTGGEIILSNKQNPLSLLQAGNVPSDLITMTLTIYQVSSGTSVDQFITDKKYATPLSQANEVFGKLSGKQLLYVLPNQDKKNVLNILTILKQDTKMFVFSYNSFAPDKFSLPKEVETIHDAILRSFGVK
ncbi:MAG: hypothetical protein V1845_04180 [bacterium]